MAVFDFAPDTHVAIEIPPEEPSAVSFNGWDFTAKPSVPYRAKFRLRLGGMRWYLNSQGTGLDLVTDAPNNAGRLREFYKEHRKSGVFTYKHEFLGYLDCRFDAPVNIPEAIPNSDGLIPEFEITLIHHNPGF